MGMESYYVNIYFYENVDTDKLAIIDKKIDDKENFVCVSYSFYSFFEGVNEIYTFIVKNKNKIKKCTTINNNELDFNGDFNCFFNSMYLYYKVNLESFYKLMGKLIVKSGKDAFVFKKKNNKRLKSFLK